PRVKGINPLAGGYEQDALNAVESEDFRASVFGKVKDVVSKELSFSFFGQQWFRGVTELISLALLASSALLWRKNPLWTMLILMTVATTVVMTVVPRYYVMVLPLLLLSWLLLLQQVIRLVPDRWRDVVLAAGLLMVVGPNLVRC